MAKKPNGYIIYRGPSLLDGKPIVAVALTGKSSNAKTGDMVQTYILADSATPPHEAVKNGEDVSVCGDCKHRPANGGACYVLTFQGPLSVWKGLQRGIYPTAEDIPALGEGRMVRLGTYGDPMAVPAAVWEQLVAKASGRTGYTHQWQNPRIPADQWRRVTDLTMASVDSETEAVQARDAKLRYFRIRTADEPIGPREFVCPASEEAGKRKTCATCGACDGSQRGAKASAVIIVHGANKPAKFAQQRAQARPQVA